MSLVKSLFLSKWHHCFWLQQADNSFLNQLLLLDYADFKRKKLKTHLTKVQQRKLRHFEACKKPYIDKALHKIIMKRSQQSRNKANKTRNTAGVLSYKKQRNYVVKLDN